VNQAISQMDEVTRQNAALVEEAADAAAAMQDQAGKLARAVSVFKLDGMAHMTAKPRANVAPPARAPTTLPQVKRLASVGSASNNDWEEL